MSIHSFLLERKDIKRLTSTGYGGWNEKTTKATIWHKGPIVATPL